MIAALARDAHVRLADFQTAGTGTGTRHALRPQVRGDVTLWLEPPGRNQPQRQALERFETLRLMLNCELQLGLLDFECHFALYRPGAGYRRPLDRLAGDVGFTGHGVRALSCVLYLNEHWTALDGGQLRLYPSDAATLDVVPEGGTLVVFFSDRFEHEVLPARRARLSLAGWFHRRGDP